MTQRESNQSDELDLRELFRYLGGLIASFFSFLLEGILRIRLLIFRNWKWFLLFSALGIGLGVFRSVKSPIFYESEMIVKVANLGGNLVFNSIENLNELAKIEANDELARQLGITEEQAAKIKKIEATPYTDEQDVIKIEILRAKVIDQVDDPNDVTTILEGFSQNNRATYIIQAQVYDIGVLDVLDSAVYNFFANNSFVKKRQFADRDELLKRKKTLEATLLELDSIQAIFTNTIVSLSKQYNSGSNNIILAETGIKSPVPVINERVEIEARIRQVEKELYLDAALEIIEPFTPFNDPANFSIVLLCGLGFTIGFLGCFGVLILLELNKYLAAKSKQAGI